MHFDMGTDLWKLRGRLVRSFMDLIVLSELRERAICGYDIILLVRRRFNVLAATGSLYALLYKMERQGLIEGSWNERRRIYRLTRKGEAAAEATHHFYKKIEDFIRMPIHSTR